MIGPTNGFVSSSLPHAHCLPNCKKGTFSHRHTHLIFTWLADDMTHFWVTPSGHGTTTPVVWGVRTSRDAWLRPQFLNSFALPIALQVKSWAAWQSMKCARDLSAITFILWPNCFFLLNLTSIRKLTASQIKWQNK